MDLFAEKNIAPMLIAQMQEPFNDSDWIYELKLDGCRCIAYLEKDKTILCNKRNMELLPRFPELKDIHTSVKDNCILDGELVVMVNGVPEFYELQKRTLMTSPVKISMAAGLLPASFVAYDCLQVNDRVLLDTPLMERKTILQELVRDNERIAVSRYIEEKGTELYALTVQKELEGVVAKRKNSLYFQGKRTKDWIKFKRMADKEFVICGYEPGQMTSLILGEYQDGILVYAGTVTMGVRRELTRILQKSTCPFAAIPQGKEQVIWCKPEYVGTVEYMPNSMDALRQPVFKGIRDDV
ncbi:MAG: DNA ligase [Lachnospiraceae bacterium]|nr:DNA ligase [Lachnospiraceae bacterium]